MYIKKKSDSMMTEQEDMEGIELGELLRILLLNLKVIIATTLLVGLATFLISTFLIKPVYTASVSIYVNNTKNISTERIESADLTASQQLVNTYVTIIQSTAVLTEVAEGIDNVYTVGEIRERMSATAIKNTEIFKVEIKDEDPKMATRIANKIARASLQELPIYIEGSSVKIIDYASVPKAPTSPNIVLNTAIGLMLGFIVGVLFVFVREMLDNRVKTEKDLENLFTLPILGKISNLAEKNTDKDQGRYSNEFHLKSSYLLNENSTFQIVEAYKVFRTNLIFSLPIEGCKTILITSSQPADGKSINCVNIAISFAQTGAKVLIIDCDLRRPNMAKMFHASETTGISNVLVHLAELEDAIHTTPYEGLDVIFSGDIPPNPAELIGSDRMQKILDDLAKQYDYIFIDSPPINMVADASILSRDVDGVVFIVREKYTEKKAMMQSIKQLSFAGANMLGFLLNGAEIQERNYGNYGKYKYSSYK